MRTTAVTPLAAGTLAALLLTGCAGQDGAQPQADADRAEQHTQADSFAIEDAWVKAVTAEDGMTGAFGLLNNPADGDLSVVAASSPVAGMVELHEVVTGDDGNAVMQEKDGGFLVPAGDTHVLEPGADHIMLMGLTEDLDPGTEVAVELEFSDGSTLEFSAPVKDYEGANENYDDGAGHGEEH
ncbi:copper chaperone PCu(A)C [Nocardiopsis ansamitocini]|uniref:Copper chaperone PCu(A)C n=1 Tax=Nocardiopsis ansamitocini TaxID=1670832 RepID=A0A9W6UL08_9ACTN|nr:copper chaperone PCu(A)C [Nocardiopsis ansamitocini]GLU50178.1 hypothetical protein Nans01_45290 [Nocardiopsis ansamitocini]